MKFHNTIQVRLASLSLVAAGICFLLYPAIRPFSDESTIQGAETFALRAIGQEAIRQNNVELLVSLSNSIRYGAGMWFSGTGLIIIMIAAIFYSAAIWKSGILSKWSGIPLAIGFIFFLPQFPAPQPVRIGHGLLVMIGCWLIAWNIFKYRPNQ